MKRSAIERLNSLYDNEKYPTVDYGSYSQEGIRALLSRFGNPHKCIRSVHIAGTNGKGSTAHMLESIVRNAGYSTGLFTSPHLENVRERIMFNRMPIPQRALSRYVEETLDAILTMSVRPTYFDALTLIAFRYFSDKKTDLAVIETGLGGRLDSTNVISPLVSIITDISLDHTGILGATRDLIAEEKSGIIKEGTPVITSNSDRVVLSVIARTAARMGAPLYAIPRDIRVGVRGRAHAGTVAFSLRFLDARIGPIRPSAPGAFQVKNAACAVAAAVLLRKSGYALSDGDIKKGISKTTIPGRFALLSRKPRLLFDPAHNPTAIDALIAMLRRAYPERKFIVVLSVMRDKDHGSMIDSIRSKLRAPIFYLALSDPRCFVPQEIDAPTSAHGNVMTVFRNFSDLLRALKGVKGKKPVIVFTGSFRLFPYARKAAAMLAKNFS